MWYNTVRTFEKEGECAIEMGQSKDKEAIVVIASSTGGPKVLTEIISALPANLHIPILVVQHMPEQYTQIFAKRLDEKSKIRVKEAQHGERILPGTVYVAKAGKHLKVCKISDYHVLMLTDEPFREGVKPCANYTYESLAECDYKKIYCIVLTGMGCDATEGISYLSASKKTEIWIQQKETCVVYGMPGSIAKTDLDYQTLSVQEMVKKIINI